MLTRRVQIRRDRPQIVVAQYPRRLSGAPTSYRVEPVTSVFWSANLRRLHLIAVGLCISTRGGGARDLLIMVLVAMITATVVVTVSHVVNWRRARTPNNA